MASSNDHFRTANPNVMAAIVKACETSSIIAAFDIYDQQGTKLWAATQAVTPKLQERLMARKLRDPIERSLQAADGVTAETLQQLAQEFGTSSHPLAAIVGPHAETLTTTIKSLDIHPVIGLLLTAARESTPGIFAHAVNGMCLAGAMFLQQPCAKITLQTALLGGLLHDIGNLYLHPLVLSDQQQSDLQTFKQIAIHPRIGRLLLEELTDYPPELWTAVDEHHERMDGSGYPSGKTGDKTSDLGKLLAIAEVVVSLALESSPTPMASARLALRFVPTEFDNRWTQLFLMADSDQGGSPDSVADGASIAEQVVQFNTLMSNAQTEAAALAGSAGARRGTAGWVAQLTKLRLQKLLQAWAETGLWAMTDGHAKAESTDSEALLKELRYRLSRVRQDITMWSGELPEAEAQKLYALRDMLTW